jgi:predicted phage-related endonuclease
MSAVSSLSRTVTLDRARRFAETTAVSASDLLHAIEELLRAVEELESVVQEQDRAIRRLQTELLQTRSTQSVDLEHWKKFFPSEPYCCMG